MSTFPGKNLGCKKKYLLSTLKFFTFYAILLYLSGILQAYSNAPVIYKIPIKINHPNAASSIDFSQPLTIPWCVAGAIPLSPNVIKTPRKCVQQSIGFKNIGTLRLECGVRSVQCAYMTSNHASHRLRCTNSINYNLPALKGLNLGPAKKSNVETTTAPIPRAMTMDK